MGRPRVAKFMGRKWTVIAKSWGGRKMWWQYLMGTALTWEMSTGCRVAPA